MLDDFYPGQYLLVMACFSFSIVQCIYPSLQIQCHPFLLRIMFHQLEGMYRILFLPFYRAPDKINTISLAADNLKLSVSTKLPIYRPMTSPAAKFAAVPIVTL